MLIGDTNKERTLNKLWKSQNRYLRLKALCCITSLWGWKRRYPCHHKKKKYLVKSLYFKLRFFRGSDIKIVCRSAQQFHIPLISTKKSKRRSWVIAIFYIIKNMIKQHEAKFQKIFLGLGWIAFNNLNVLVNTYYTTH